jgi:hypothetical protein
MAKQTITRVDYGESAQANSSGASIALSCTGSFRLVVAVVHFYSGYWQTYPSVTSITFDGTGNDLTLAHSHSFSHSGDNIYGWHGIYYMVAPNTGTANDLDVTISGDGGHVIHAATYTGVIQSSPLRQYGNSSITWPGDYKYYTQGNTSGDMIMTCGSTWQGSSVNCTGAYDTGVYGSVRGASGDITGTGSNQIGVNTSSNHWGGSLGAVFIQADAGIPMDELTLAGSVPDLTPVGGAISTPMDELTLAGSVPAATLAPGAVSPDMDELTLASSIPALEPVIVPLVHKRNFIRPRSRSLLNTPISKTTTE